jgi:hypothetical protein
LQIARRDTVEYPKKVSIIFLNMIHAVIISG